MTYHIFCGDALNVLRTLPNASVQCCITSPAYYGLRRYLPPGHPDENKEHGRERTPEEYVANLVAVFREVRRVLRDDGVIFVNLGDSYAGYHGNSRVPDEDAPSNKPGYVENMRESTVGKSGLKQKDLLGIPWMVAFALRADGWYLRQDIIWHKPNPMPESVTDRCTKAHEYVFLLSKSPRYFFDADAIREPHTSGANTAEGLKARQTIGDPNGKRSNTKSMNDGRDRTKPPSRPPGYIGHIAGRNKRSVWTVTPKPFPGSHFATFPPDLVEPMIKAGTSEKGCCPKCGSPWRRQITKGEPLAEQKTACGADASGNYEGESTKGHDNAGVQNASDVKRRILEGMRERISTWTPGCSCDGVDRRIIQTPLGERVGNDPSLETGRAGLNRPRGEEEGRRPITRYEQKEYAKQIRESEHFAEMAKDASTAIDHYTRTDDSGARPVPPELLGAWLSRGWLQQVTVPETSPGFEPVPCLVLDPFSGAGTTLLVAVKLGRRGIGIELNQAYVDMANKRIQDFLQNDLSFLK